MNVGEAEQACRDAVERFPEEPRYMFQLARVLDIRDSDEEALQWFARAAELDYGPSLFALGRAYASGFGGVERDPNVALALFIRAEEVGFAAARPFADQIAAELAKTGDAPSSQLITTDSAARENLCDRLAAHPADPVRVGSGVPDASLDAEQGIAACEEAVLRFPDVARFEFQLGRSLLAASRDEEARSYIVAAAERGHSGAKAYLADMYLEGAHGVPQDTAAAFALYQEAATGGFAPARQAVTVLQTAAASQASRPVAAGPSEINLSCDTLGTLANHFGEPGNYLSLQFRIRLNYERNTAYVSSRNGRDGLPIIGGEYVMNNVEYPLVSRDDDNFEFVTEPLGSTRQRASVIVNYDSGQLYYTNRHVAYSLFGALPVTNTFTMEGYCALEAATPQRRRRSR